MACKIVVNRDSGNCKRVDVEALATAIGCGDAQIENICETSDWSAEGFDTVVVCGGDGTLHHAIDKCQNQRVIYVPCGTLNETSTTESVLTSVGKVNGENFSYVCACGSFTAIGYSAKCRHKQRWHRLAYLPQIFTQYKCHDIAATIELDGEILQQDNYTLLMVIKGNRCFGFNFNRSYKQDKRLYLLAIKSHGRDCLKNRIKMFFPFFRVFFCGISHPMSKNRWFLVPFDKLTVRLNNEQNFCLDGEKRTLSGVLEFSEQKLNNEIHIIKPPCCRRRKIRQCTKK